MPYNRTTNKDLKIPSTINNKIVNNNKQVIQSTKKYINSDKMGGNKFVVGIHIYINFFAVSIIKQIRMEKEERGKAM